MTSDELKLMIREEYPLVWKATKPWIIKTTDPIKVGQRVRDGLKKKGFRDIRDEDNLVETLDEAEEFLMK